ncbi:MAG: serine O-acetyltransferase [Pseudomonadota bacterium]
MTFHDVRMLLAADLSRQAPLERFRVFKYLFSTNPSKRAVSRIRMAQFLQAKGFRKLAELLLSGLKNRLGVYVGVTAKIGSGLKLPHATSVVIGHGTIIGKDCAIYQQTTIAGAPSEKEGDYRRLGDSVVMYAGAKVVGIGSVGNNVIIGANAVVNKAFGDNVVLAGVPARVVRRLDPIELAPSHNDSKCGITFSVRNC